MTTAWKFASEIENGSEGYSYGQPCDFNQLRNYIVDDKKQEFTQLLRSTLDAAIKDFDNEFNLSHELVWYCNINGAINCAAALLNGDTGLTLDLNSPRLYSLHGAALVLSPKMTRFFLKSGVRATAKISNPENFVEDGLTPIDFALRSIRNMVCWTENESLYSLIVELTGEGMIEPTQTMRLLIQDLSESEASEIICHYAGDAKIIELATLLIMCSERSIMVDNIYVPSNYVSQQDKMSLRQYVVNQIVLLENMVRELVEVDDYKLAEYGKLKESMVSILMLLEIFQRTGDKIASVVRLTNHSYPTTHMSIARVFELSGFKLIGEDTSHLRNPLIESMFTERRRQKSLDELLPKVNGNFQSGVPQLGSLKTMPDFGWDDTDPNYQKLLPLRVVLEAFSSVTRDKDWVSNESIFKLIIILCLPKMKEPLDAARTFAEKSEKINEIAFCFAKEGKLIELAIILMVAGQKVMAPIKYKIKGEKSMRSMTIQQFINSELAQAIDLECRLIGRMTEEEKELSNFCKQKKLSVMSALTLLEIFAKAGPALQIYILREKGNTHKDEVTKDVSKLLSKAGFKLKSKDAEISDSVDSSIKVAFKRWAETIGDLNKRSGILQDLNEVTEMPKRSGSQSQGLRRLSYVLPCGFVETHAAHGRLNDMRKFLFTRYPRECMSLPSSAQSFRAFWTSNGRGCYFNGSPKVIGVQQGYVKGVNQTVPKFPVNKQFASVASSIRRRVKFA